MPNSHRSPTTSSNADNPAYFTMSKYDNFRRKTVEVHVGSTAIGGGNPVRLQSMTTTPTLDVEASAAQTLSIAAAGAELVRLTAQGVAHAQKLADIHAAVRSAGCDVPLVADIHFNPAAAFEAATHVEKVRINPGNFFDPGRTFRKMEFTDEEYAAELAKIHDKFVPFLELCREHGTAIRIGVNHGSLSDRIMSRYGDGAEGMVESALEYLRICQAVGFDNVVISIKASDVPVMTDTVRLLVERMEAEGMRYPLHLGVTEAGNAREGRIKSAVGIGSLLADGIGDTIRVSLSEDPENEIPVARAIVGHMEKRVGADGTLASPQRPGRQPKRRQSAVCERLGIGGHLPTGILGDTVRDPQEDEACIITASSGDRIGFIRESIAALPTGLPAIAVVDYPELTDRNDVALAAAIDLGTILLDGYQDGIGITSPAVTAEEAAEICRDIIQAAGLQRFKAEIVACPGCGRTLYALPEVLERVKAACSHLSHLKIAVMGCIVNGPGEMAGADYGYVGAGPGTVSIYRGIECVARRIDSDEALDRLIDLIKADGQWHD